MTDPCNCDQSLALTEQNRKLKQIILKLVDSMPFTDNSAVEEMVNEHGIKYSELLEG